MSKYGVKNKRWKRGAHIKKVRVSRGGIRL